VPRLRCERFSPTRFSFTGADPNCGNLADRSARPRRQTKNAVRYVSRWRLPSVIRRSVNKTAKARLPSCAQVSAAATISHCGSKRPRQNAVAGSGHGLRQLAFKILRRIMFKMTRPERGGRPVAGPPAEDSSYRSHGWRDFSPGANAISAMREPFGPAQEFLVIGYLSVYDNGSCAAMQF
jgi:hypothetical protein